MASSLFFFLFLLCRLCERDGANPYWNSAWLPPPRPWLQSWSEWTFYERHDDCTLRAMYNKSCIHIPWSSVEKAAWDAHYISTKSHESEHDESWVEWRRKSELERMHQTLILSACFCSVEFQLEKCRWWYADGAGAAATVENTQIFVVDFSFVIVVDAVESLSAFELLIYSQKATKMKNTQWECPRHTELPSPTSTAGMRRLHRRHDVKNFLHFPTAKALWTSTLMHSRVVQPIMMSWVFNVESGFCRKVGGCGGDSIAVILNIEPSSKMTQTDVQTHSKGWISCRNKECKIFDFSGLVLSGSSPFGLVFLLMHF